MSVYTSYKLFIYSLNIIFHTHMPYSYSHKGWGIIFAFILLLMRLLFIVVFMMISFGIMTISYHISYT